MMVDLTPAEIDALLKLELPIAKYPMDLLRDLVQARRKLRVALQPTLPPEASDA